MHNWVRSKIGGYSVCEGDTDCLDASACEQLMSAEIPGISDVGKEVEVECEASDLIGREEQYNVSSDAILKQPLPRVGDRVVIVQHATIPFGAPGRGDGGLHDVADADGVVGCSVRGGSAGGECEGGGEVRGESGVGERRGVER